MEGSGGTRQRDGADQTNRELGIDHNAQSTTWMRGTDLSSWYFASCNIEWGECIRTDEQGIAGEGEGEGEAMTTMTWGTHLLRVDENGVDVSRRVVRLVDAEERARQDAKIESGRTAT